jgi:molybdenum cofactor cytidylyltransferase
VSRTKAGPTIVGLLLAAGIGRRYDPTGARLKLLQPAGSGPHAGAPLAVAALRNLRAAIVDVIAVVRPADSGSQHELHAQLAMEGAELVLCPDADAGIGRSLACGVRARPDAAGWLIALADMPEIRPSTIGAVRDAIAAGADAAAPAYAGQRGHPVAFGPACRAELLALTGDRGARGVLAAHPPRLIDVDDPGCLLDIDVPTAD